MPAIRCCSIAFCAIALAAILGCSSIPGWVHTLPAKSSDGTQELPTAGTYIRAAESRYSVANKVASTEAREWLEIGTHGVQTYTKVHLYSERTRTRLRRVAYKETGTIQAAGAWLLFSPTSAIVFREEKPASESPRRLPLPAPDKAQPNAEGTAQLSIQPLLYHYDAVNMVITPAVFERYGEIFEHGIYEGCQQPHQAVGKKFETLYDQYNQKVFHRHGYFRSKGEDQAPRKRNVLRPMRSKSPS